MNASPRTSETHPLRIAFVPCLAGRVGITLCPGKKGESVFGPPWDRDLATDLNAIAESGCATLVTLIEPHEFELLGLMNFEEAVQAAGLDWLHLPIRDVDVPGPVFERQWAVEGPRLLSELRECRSVVVHCRGGRGRAGLVAARLLAETGTPPDEAIARIRAARPGAIETQAQEDHIRHVVER